MKFAETLFEIARNDLEASKCLFERELYPQAVFYLQQSVEKATKSFGLLNDVIKEEELKNVVGHNPLKVYKKSIENQEEKIERITDAIEKVPKLGETKLIKDFNFRNYHKKIAESLTWFGSLDEVKEEILFIQKSELRSAIQELDNIESELESLQGININSNEELLKESLEEYKKASMEILDAFYEFSPQKIEKVKEDLYKNKILDLNLMKEMIKAIQSAPIKNAIYVTYSLLYLSLIMLPHALVTRYPDNNHDPLKIYNKNLPLIQLFGNMVEIMEKTLSKLENLLTESRG